MKKFLDNIIQAVSFPNDLTIVLATIIFCLILLAGLFWAMFSFFGIYGIFAAIIVLVLARFMYAGVTGK